MPTSRRCRASPPPARTVLSGLDGLPLSINVWRCFLQLRRRPRASSCWRWRSCRCWASAASQLFKAETPGPMKDQQADAAHRRDRARPVDGVRRAVAGLLARLSRGRHGLGRRVHAHVLDREPGRPVVARRQLRPLELAAASRPSRWCSCCCPASASRSTSSPGAHRSLRALWRDVELRAYLARGARQRSSLISLYLSAHGNYADVSRGAAPRRVPRGLGGHHRRLRDRRLRAVAAVRTGADDRCSAASPPAPARPAAASR